ncbi:hypothetical protein [Streptomyces sp. NPDC002082]|uniref:hypothetical protein n=1 Tax=Streptomyces sp. NPDC002082 TaxID=3154772 RepID=UPI0033320BC0
MPVAKGDLHDAQVLARRSHRTCADLYVEVGAVTIQVRGLVAGPGDLDVDGVVLHGLAPPHAHQGFRLC